MPMPLSLSLSVDRWMAKERTEQPDNQVSKKHKGHFIAMSTLRPLPPFSHSNSTYLWMDPGTGFETRGGMHSFQPNTVNCSSSGPTCRPRVSANRLVCPSPTPFPYCRSHTRIMLITGHLRVSRST